MRSKRSVVLAKSWTPNAEPSARRRIGSRGGSERVAEPPQSKKPKRTSRAFSRTSTTSNARDTTRSSNSNTESFELHFAGGGGRWLVLCFVVCSFFRLLLWLDFFIGVDMTICSGAGKRLVLVRSWEVYLNHDSNSV